MGCNNDVCTYHDYVVLENYVNKTYHLDNLVDLAKKYIDTARGDLRVGGVTFIGEAPDTQILPAMYATYDDYRGYQVASVAFSEDRSAINDSSREDVNYLAIWKKGDVTIFSFSTHIDSLLKSNPLLNNGN